MSFPSTQQSNTQELWELLKHPISFTQTSKSFYDWYQSIERPLYSPCHAHIYLKIQICTFLYCLVYLIPELSGISWLIILGECISFKCLFTSRNRHEKLLNSSTYMYLLYFSGAKLVFVYLSSILISNSTLTILIFVIYLIICNAGDVKMLFCFIVFSWVQNAQISSFLCYFIALNIILFYEPITTTNQSLSSEIFNGKNTSNNSLIKLSEVIHIFILTLNIFYNDRGLDHNLWPLCIYISLISITYVTEKIDNLFYRFKRKHRNKGDMNFIVQQYY